MWPFLLVCDIPSFVGKGNVDLGITGQDVILEAQMEEHVTEILQLGFGKCALQVQVPEAGEIKTVEDLAGKRVVLVLCGFQVESGVGQALRNVGLLDMQGVELFETFSDAVECECMGAVRVTGVG